MQAIVIDDSRAMRIMLKKILTGMSFEVTEAREGQDALDQLAAGSRPDLALVDWNMPVMNGFDFLKAVRKDHAFDAMFIVMVTTEIEMKHIASALEAGANEYVMKPFTCEGMREKLQLLGFGQAAV